MIGNPLSPKASSAVSTARARSETKTAVAPSASPRGPIARANSRPCAESRSGSQPVAWPVSLSSVRECVS